jgi:aspartate aminotransferase
MTEEFARRRKYMVDRVNSIPGLRATLPGGAFYCWIDVYGLLGKSIEGSSMKNSMELTEALLSKAHVAVVPGAVFGDDRYLRISYATSIENITEGLNRIENFVRKVA